MSTQQHPTTGEESPLKALEAALESPLVPGELDTWLETVEQAFQQAEGELRERLSNEHRRQLKQVQKQDAELSTRVEELGETDQELLDRLEHLGRHLRALRERGDGDGETQRVDRSAERLSEEGLKFVIDVRKQEAAINTWFLEAFQRDRGVAD
jgi:uncharacterized membrane protein YccC